MEEALSRVVPDSNCHVILSIRHGLVWTKPDMMKIATRFFGADQVRFGLITLVGPTHDAVAEATAGQLDVVESPIGSVATSGGRGRPQLVPTARDVPCMG